MVPKHFASKNVHMIPHYILVESLYGKARHFRAFGKCQVKDAMHQLQKQTPDLPYLFHSKFCHSGPYPISRKLQIEASLISNLICMY